ncbi:MAG TPA: histidine kinase [Candidatus Binatia bacterium]|nr:histidine kinase [Candidatus Binatia bacterium]
MMRSLSYYRPRALRRGAPLEAFSQTENIIAFCRVLLAATTLAVFIVDPRQPSFRPDLGLVVLSSYVGFSLLLFLLARAGYVKPEVRGWLVAADIAWIAVITLFTEGGATPFFLLNMFVISSVSVRWGLAASAPITVLLALLYPGLILFAGHVIDADAFPFARAHWFRPIYLLALGYLVAYLGEHERRSKQKLGLMLDLTTVFRRHRAPASGFTRLMRWALDYFAAQRALLVLRDPESGKFFTWEVARRPGGSRIGLRITDGEPFPFSFATSTEGFLANELRPGAGTALCYDVVSGAMQRKAIAPDIPLPGDGRAQALLVAPVLIQRQLRGRAVVARETRRKFTRDDLEFLLLLVGQAAAGFEAVRLQAKAEEVAVLEERARIARDLHDGFIQSLAGIDLRVEACKLLLQRDPGRVPRELEDLHQAVDRGYREVRHYLAVLRGSGAEAHDLCATLDRLAAEFSLRERLRVHLARPPADPGLPAATSYELTQIVREALRNAVRHGHATQAVVKLATGPAHLYLVVRDNGSGFRDGNGTTDADGFLVPAAAPWSIRERAATLGASLRVWSRPGRGAEVSLVVPAPPGAWQRVADRRKA